MIRAILLAAASTLAAGPVLALSCLEPSVARSFNEARAAAEVYAVVLGRFEFDRADLPSADAEGVTIPATFAGRVLGSDGFVTEARRPVRLDVTCAMSWCGQIEPGTETLAFVEQGEDGLRVEVSACPRWVFQKPSAEQMEMARSCMAGGCE